MADALVFDRLASTLKKELELLNARDPQEQHVLRVVQGVQQLLVSTDAHTQRYSDQLIDIYKRTSDATIHNFRTARADMKFLLATAKQDDLDPESRKLLKQVAQQFSGDINTRSNPLSRGVRALRSAWENTDLVSIISGAATNSPITMLATKYFSELRDQRKERRVSAQRDSMQSRLNLIEGLQQQQPQVEDSLPQNLPERDDDTGYTDDRVVPELVKQTALAQETVNILRDDNTRDTEIARRSDDDTNDALLQWERLFKKPEDQPAIIPQPVTEQKRQPSFLESLLSRLSFFGISLSGLFTPLKLLKDGLGTLASMSIPLLVRGIAGIPTMIAIAAAGAVGYAAGTALRNLKPFGEENPSIGEWSDIMITWWKANSWGGGGASFDDAKSAIMSLRKTPTALSNPTAAGVPPMVPSHAPAAPPLAPLPSRSIVPDFAPSTPSSGAMGSIVSGSVSRAPETDRFSELGRYTSQLESGSGNRSAQLGIVGHDSTGGASYGMWQIETNRGTMRRFLQFADIMHPELGKRLKDAGGEEAARRQDPTFVRTWKELAMRQPDAFFRLQRDFIHMNNYTPALEGVKTATGIDIGSKSAAVQELLFSTATQFGPGKPGSGLGAVAIFEKALQTNPANDDELIRAVIAEKTRRVAGSRQMSPGERSGSISRFEREETDMTNTMPVLPSRPIAGATPTRLPMTMGLVSASQEAQLASRTGGGSSVGNVTVAAPTVQTVNQVAQSTVVMPILPRNREFTFDRIHRGPFSD